MAITVRRVPMRLQERMVNNAFSQQLRHVMI